MPAAAFPFIAAGVKSAAPWVYKAIAALVGADFASSLVTDRSLSDRLFGADIEEATKEHESRQKQEALKYQRRGLREQEIREHAGNLGPDPQSLLNMLAMMSDPIAARKLPFRSSGMVEQVAQQLGMTGDELESRTRPLPPMIDELYRISGRVPETTTTPMGY